MAIEITLIGEPSRSGSGKRDIVRALVGTTLWFERSCPYPVMRAYPTESGLAFELHPAASPIFFDLEGKHVVLRARTSAVGPGYHAAVIDCARAIEAANCLTWKETPTESDQGDYFATGDFERLRGHFRTWLRGLCTSVLETNDRGGDGSLKVAMETNQWVNSKAFLATPVGPRDRDWTIRVAEGKHSGEDFFAWPDQGVSSSYWLGTALSLMWGSITWQPPTSEEELAVMADAHRCLLHAFKHDPECADIPWRAWFELASLLGEALPDSASKASTDEQEIGYLRLRAA